MGLNYHFHNVLCINVLHHLYRKMCEVSNLSGRQKSPKGNAERQKKGPFKPRWWGVGLGWEGRGWDNTGGCWTRAQGGLRLYRRLPSLLHNSNFSSSPRAAGDLQRLTHR